MVSLPPLYPRSSSNPLPSAWDGQAWEAGPLHPPVAWVRVWGGWVGGSPPTTHVAVNAGWITLKSGLGAAQEQPKSSPKATALSSSEAPKSKQPRNPKNCKKCHFTYLGGGCTLGTIVFLGRARLPLMGGEEGRP